MKNKEPIILSTEKLETLLLTSGELYNIISTMDLPEKRTDISSEANCRWLLRNMFVRNGEHPKLKLAEDLVKKLLEMYNEKD